MIFDELYQKVIFAKAQNRALSLADHTYSKAVPDCVRSMEPDCAFLPEAANAF